jgi:Putative Ig domain
MILILLILLLSTACGAPSPRLIPSAPPQSPPLTITTTSLPDFFVGQFYMVKIEAAGGIPPYFWQLSSGNLPPGLILDSTTGIISGTPESPASESFVIEVRDSAK